MAKASSKARTRKAHARKANDDSLDHSWAKKRSENIEKMWRQARTDDVYALALAIDVITSRANDIWQVGDANYSLLLSTVATRLGNIRVTMQRKQERKLARRRAS